MSEQIVYLPDDIATEGKQLLENANLKVMVGSGRTRQLMMTEGNNANAVIIGTQPFDAEIMDSMPNLKVIGRNGVGYDSVDIAAATERGIQVVNTPTALSGSVAETAVTELLTISKNIYQDSKALNEGNWAYRKTHLGHDVYGKTVGILGFGRIGKEVAQKLSGFGVNIIAVDPFAEDTENVKIVDRDYLFKHADYVMVHLPAIPETNHSIGKAEFDLMKNTAYLINMARGSILIEEDLVTALKNHDIAGAALDVFEEEPLPTSNRLVGLENVLLTPHIASNTVETKRQMALDVSHDIIDVLHGREPKYKVNKL